MAADVEWSAFLPAPVREVPADLAVVAVFTVGTVLSATVPVVAETPLRIVLGIPFVLFLPGYALVAALFPEAGEGPADASDGTSGPQAGATDRRGIDGVERAALSFGLSVAVSPLIVLALNVTPWGIELVPILLGVGGFTLAATAVATQRRRALAPSERFGVPYRTWVAAARAELLAPDSGTDAALNVLLVCSVLLAVGAVGYAVAVPTPGESFSELYLLTETDDGELVADDYPTEFARGEARPLVVGVGNHEYERTQYTVVIELQDVAFTGPNGTRLRVRREAELARFQATLAHDETRHRTVSLAPTMTGERLRIRFFLYRGGAPADPSLENAYRENHLWVSVSE